MSGMGTMLGFLLAGGLFGLLTVVLVPYWWTQRPSARTALRLARYAWRPVDANSVGPLFRSDAVFEAEGKSALQRLLARISNRFANIGGGRAVRRLILFACLVGAAGLIATLWLSADPGLALLVGFGTGVAALPIGYLQMKRRWQVAFLNHLADAIDLVVRAVRAGIPVAEAIRTAGLEVQDPVRQEFKGISDAIDLGIDLKEALRAAAGRIRLSDFDFFVITLVIQRETGGQLAETLEGLSLILRRRKELRLKIKAMTAEGRMSAAIVGGMPIAAGAAMYAIDPGHVGRLFEPGTGQTMLIIALSMMALGIVIVHHMTKVKP